MPQEKLYHGFDWLRLRPMALNDKFLWKISKKSKGFFVLDWFAGPNP
jgi:hypothetical protein